MPLAKKPSQQSNATEAKFASQMPEPDCMKKTRLEIPGFEENFVSGQIQVTSPSLIQQNTSNNLQSDLSIDQANQLDMLFQQEFNSNVGVFGRKSDRLICDSSEKVANGDIVSSSMDFKNDPISSIIGQDDPFLDQTSQTNDNYNTNNLPPTFREYTPSE